MVGSHMCDFNKENQLQIYGFVDEKQSENVSHLIDEKKLK